MQTVFVGLSGGVDSAVSAALLKDAGYRVVGAFIKIWRPEFIECPWRRDRLDAMRVCAHLEIPFREIDLSEEYKRDVIDDMVAGYAGGITPNPDVLCNRHIKFGAFKAWALSQGAERIATGHYARLAETDGGIALRRAADDSKDQSYFLARLSRDELTGALFPLGEMHKTQVRALAERYGLPNARKKDSQGLCFVGDVDMREFLAHYLPLEKGDVLDESGNVVGEHDGAALYTLGERHGFRMLVKGERDAPRYVIATDTRRNTITVSPERARAARTQIALARMRWISEAPSFPLQALAQARYHERPVPCELRIEEGKMIAHFNEPHLAPPGQTLALYDGDRLLGSGVITA